MQEQMELLRELQGLDQELLRVRQSRQKLEAELTLLGGNVEWDLNGLAAPSVTRDEDGRRHAEIEPPELAGAEDLRDWLAALAPCHQRIVC